MCNLFLLRNFFLASILMVMIFSGSARNCFGQRDYFDNAVIEALKEKITDEKISLEPVYNSASGIMKVKARIDEITDIKLEQFDTKFSSFKIKVAYHDGSTTNIHGRYISYLEVPVAARYLKSGEIITSGDINFSREKFNDVKDSYATEVKEVIGKQLRRYIPAAGKFKLNDLVNPIVIKNNDPVELIYLSGTISLRTSGASLGAGAVGDNIRVKNLSSGAVLLGRVVNKNLVRVGEE